MGKLPQLPGTASGSWSAPAGWRSPPLPSAVPASLPAWPAGKVSGTEEEEIASGPSCAAPSEREVLAVLKLFSDRRSSQRTRHCSETGSGSGGGGPAAGRPHQSDATGSQNRTGWTLPEPEKVRSVEVVKTKFVVYLCASHNDNVTTDTLTNLTGISFQKHKKLCCFTTLLQYITMIRTEAGLHQESLISDRGGGGFSFVA